MKAKTKDKERESCPIWTITNQISICFHPTLKEELIHADYLVRTIKKILVEMMAKRN